MKNLQLGILIIILCTGYIPGGALGAQDQLPAGHDNPDCRQCHLRTASSAASPTTDNQTCLNCHSQQTVSRRIDLGFHDTANEGRCLNCHSYHAPESITTTQGTIDLKSLDQINLEHCMSCHNAAGPMETLSEAHLVAARLYHEDASSLQGISPSQACLNCHSNSSATAWQTAADGDVLAFREHASHPFEIEVIPGQGSYAHRIRHQIDDRVPLVDRTIQCQTCHQLNSGNTDLIAGFENSTDLCLGCHQFRDQSAENLVATLSTRP